MGESTRSAPIDALCRCSVSPSTVSEDFPSLESVVLRMLQSLGHRSADSQNIHRELPSYQTPLRVHTGRYILFVKQLS